MKKTKTGDSIHLTLGGIIEADMLQSVPVENDRRKADRRGFERTEFPRVSVDPLRTLR